MLLKVIATGRTWGDKIDPKQSKMNVAGVSCLIDEFDGWEGPTEPGKKGQYFRFTSLSVEKMRDDRFKDTPDAG